MKFANQPCRIVRALLYPEFKLTGISRVREPRHVRIEEQCGERASSPVISHQLYSHIFLHGASGKVVENVCWYGLLGIRSVVCAASRYCLEEPEDVRWDFRAILGGSNGCREH